MVKEMNATKIINDTIEFLEKNYPQKQKVEWVIAEGYGSIETPEGGTGFGVFDTDTLKIYIATDVPEPETSLIETTAHEYKHFMQQCEEQPFDEEEAEAFGLYILYLMQKER